GAVGQRVGDAGVQAAWVLACGHGVEDGVEVGLGRAQRVAGGEGARVVVDEGDRVTLGDGAYAPVHARRGEVARILLELRDLDGLARTVGERRRGAAERVGAAVVVVLGEVAVGDVAALV